VYSAGHINISKGILNVTSHGCNRKLTTTTTTRMVMIKTGTVPILIKN
jgi:hypothetical protein